MKLDLLLPRLIMAYWTRVNETTIAFNLMFGQEATLPIDIIYDFSSDVSENPTSKYAMNFRNKWIRCTA